MLLISGPNKNDVGSDRNKLTKIRDLDQETDDSIMFSQCESFSEYKAEFLQQTVDTHNQFLSHKKITFTSKPSHYLMSNLKKHCYSLFQIKYSDEFFTKISDQTYYTIFGMDCLSKELVCFAVIDITKITERNAEILTIGVVKEYQGRKYGTKLLCKVLEELTLKGLRLVRLIVQVNNFVALNLYKKSGFDIENEVEDYYMCLTGNDRRAFVMKKRLDIRRFWVFEIFKRMATIFKLY